MDPRAGLDDMEKRKFLILSGPELGPFGRVARSRDLSCDGIQSPEDWSAATSVNIVHIKCSSDSST
jgi:hypothetical protein